MTPSTLTSGQEQMLLGTMLGDGSMDTRDKNPRYHSQHGWVQNDYNCRKYRVLSEFVRTPPAKQKNGGYGEWRSCWHTLTSPALWPTASLCLHKGKKRVTQAWLDRLTWEGVAWWYQDDGSLSGRTATFHTEGFSQGEVELLARDLRRRGLAATVLPRASRHNPDKTYYLIALSTASTYLLAQEIAPYVCPEMQYKLDLPERIPLTCHWCGGSFEPPEGSTKARYVEPKARVCCGEPDCRKRQRQAAVSKYDSVPENRIKKNEQTRQHYHGDLASQRERGRVKAAAARAADPAPARAAKARYLVKQQDLRRRMPWTCQRCGLSEPRGDRPSKTQYCPACREVVTREVKQRHQALRTASNREAFGESAG